MAKVKYIDPIEYVSGKISKRHRTCYNHRSKVNNRGELINYTSTPGKRTTDYSATEQAQHTRFGAIRQMIVARNNDTTKRVADLAAFKAQSVYKTLYAYQWHVCATEYDAED